MANYDDILDQYAKQRETTAAPTTTPTQSTDKYSLILDNMANQRDQRFAISVGNAVKGSPERAAEIQRIGKELNLSPSAVEANYDNALITYKQRMLDRQRAAQDDPILSMQMTNPDFAAVAHDDWWNLSTAGKVMRWFKEIPQDAAKGFQAGQLQYEQSKLAFQEMQSGVILPDVRKRLKDMDQELKGLKGTGGFVEEALKVVGQWGSTVPAALEFGSVAGITAGGVGLAMGPGAPVAAPAAALTAFGVGTAVKMAEEVFGVEGGSAYKEMIDEGVTPETARYVGGAVGMVNSLLEVTGMSFVAAPFKKALIKEATHQIAESLAKPTMRMAVQEFGKNYGKAIAGEVGTELLQEMSAIVGSDIANLYDKPAYQSKFLTEEGRTEIVSRLGDVFESTVKAMALLGAPGAAIGFRSDYKQVKEAERQTQFFEALNTASENSKLRERSPDAFHNLINQQAAATGVENIYVDGERFAQSMIDANITVDQLKQVLPNVAGQISEALRIGEDIVIPTADYATYVAGTKFGQSLLPHVRANIDAISASEAVEFESQKKALLDAAVQKVEQKKAEDKVFAESATKVQSQFEQQIAGATTIYTPQQLKREAMLMSRMYEVMAERMGILPEQAYEMYPITIGKEGQAVFSQADMAGITVQTDNQQINVTSDAGQVIADIRDDGVHILNAEVKMESRGQGEGLRLYQALVDKALDQGLTVYSDATVQPEAARIYEALKRRGYDVKQREGTTVTKVGSVVGKGISEPAFEIVGRAPQQYNIGQGAENGLQPESAGNGAGRYSGGGLTTLEGSPVIEGATGPDPSLVAVAEQYASDNGIDLKRQAEYVEVDPERAARIAAAYDAMLHQPQDPAVKEAYENLIQQTMAQYRALEAAGYKFYFFDETNDPYAGNPWNAMRDLRQNKVMGVFATEAGFGSGATEINVEDNPLLADTGIEWPYGSLEGEPKRVLANDLFRAVHDAFGHGLEGAGFRARGEENAWQAHAKLFTGSALAALTTETRGQNSWLNFGPFGEQNRTAAVEETVFADQKTGLMPSWTWTEGRAVDAKIGDANEILKQTGTGGAGSGNTLRANDLGVAVEYGTARDGASSFVGVHYSKQPRTSLSGYYYGQGITGAEQRRLQNADSRLKNRIHFYVDTGAGVRPESGVGQYVHAVRLNNLYNTSLDPLGLLQAASANGRDAENRWFNEFEKSVIDAGFDGVVIPGAQGNQGVAVLLGPQHKAVEVEQKGKHQELLLREASRKEFNQRNNTDRGGFNPRDLSITLTKDADYSTLHHETMHAIVEIYARIASSPNAPATIAEDFQKLMDFVGVKDVATWNGLTLEEQRPYHEALASAHEIWFFEGKAPSVELQPVFDRISVWMRKVYNYIATTINDMYKANYGRDLPVLNDEVRSVFARMYASEEQVSQAEQVRYMMPMFQTQEQSGMDDATWQVYQELYQEAHDASVTDLTKASLRNMRWLSNARSRILKDLQKAADTQRKEVREQVTAEVENDPVYLAMRFLKRGEIVLPDGTVQKLDGNFKFSIAALEEMYMGEGDKYALFDWSELGHGKYGMLAKEGLAPDMVADMFGFASGDVLVRSLIAARPINEEIKARTDARMEAEYGDMTDEREIQLKVEEALHNEARARFVATELRFLNKSTQPVRLMMQAARQAARDILAGKPIKDIRPRDYSLAEARAAKQTEKHMKKGEAALAAKSKQNQLVQNQLAAEAIKARQEVEKGVDSFKKMFKSDEKMAKNRNMDLVDAARSILAYYGLGQKNKAPTDYIDKLRTYNPDLYAELEPLILDAATGAKDYTDLTLTEFRLMKEAVDTLWFQSKREKQIMIEGNAIALEQVTGELNARLAAIGIPTKVAGEQAAPDKKDRAIRAFYEAKAATRRVEHWANATDGAKGVGPFTTYIWRPIRQALDAYRAMRNVYTKRYVDSIGKLDLPVAKIEASELGYTFGNGNGGIGKAELLGALLHTGNESNYRKLLLGRGWGVLLEDGTLDDGNWRAFEARMIAEGKLTKADYDWAQSVWDLNEELKPMAQKAHHDLYGYYFKEVPANQVVNQLGVWRGGYVPAKTDPFIVRDAQKQAKMEELESDFRNAMPSTGMGFTKGRVEYNKPLSLDIRVMAKHIDDVIRFVNVQPAVKDVVKILRNREFADNISRLDPSVIEDMLLPWLNRAARQITSESGKHKAIDAFWRGVRSRTGISIMFANLTNALQQVTGYFPAMLKTDAKYLRGALSKYVFSPTAISEEVAELSPFMADRLQNQMIEIQDMMNDLVLNPSKFNKIQKWATHHGYFLQSSFQNQVDVVTWVATFNKTLADLKSDTNDQAAMREAVQQADAAVRMTQSSLAAEDIASFEVGTPFYRTFIQFSGYFNMLANLNADEYIKVFRDMGWRGNKGKLAMIYVLGFMMPMVLSDAIVRTMGGAWDDEDDDGYLDEVMEWFFGSQVRGGVALIPGFGPGVAAVINAFNDKPYDDRMATSPAVSALEGATVGVVKAGMNVVDESKQVTGKNVRDVLTLLSLVTGIPLTVLGRPIGYEMEVERGKITPTDTIDYIRGLVTGKASEASRK